MIVFFGPAGVGKSMQGQMLAARHGWRWLSAGNLLREKSSDPEIAKMLTTGNLLPPQIVNRVVLTATDLAHSEGVRVILDGYPRSLDQANKLTDHETKRASRIGVNIAIVISAPAEEIFKRLAIRGRMDDAPDTIAHRLEVYKQETEPVLNYYRELGVPVVEIDGVGTVGEVHDRIEEALIAHGLESA